MNVVNYIGIEKMWKYIPHFIAWYSLRVVL